VLKFGRVEEVLEDFLI